MIAIVLFSECKIKEGKIELVFHARYPSKIPKM